VVRQWLVAEWFEPFVEFSDPPGTWSVPPELRISADVDDSGVPQDAEMLGNGRLAHVEGGYEFTDATLALSEKIEDPPAIRVSHHIEHGARHHLERRRARWV
jgi:hypothetical protein